MSDRDRHAIPDAPPRALRRAVEGLMPLFAGACWRRLPGGRTNRVWRLDQPSYFGPDRLKGFGSPTESVGGEPSRRLRDALVVKLCDGPSTPLFPNDPAAEIVALRHLDGTGLAPRPVGGVSTSSGAAIVYHHVEATGPVEPAAAARALAALHGLAPPAGLRRTPIDSQGLLARLWAVIRTLRAPPPSILRDPPPLPPLSAIAPVFRHGDPTQGNAVGAARGAVLIDWQCPALGDPCDDLAILLSPAMRHLDGFSPLTPSQRRGAIDAYGSCTIAERLRALAPLHGATIAAHCLWRAERGWPGARAAAAVELRALERCTDQDA